MTDHNPLYQPADVPAFAAIRPEHAAVIPQMLQENRAAIEDLIARGDYSWDGLIQPLERLENRLAKAFTAPSKACATAPLTPRSAHRGAKSSTTR